jgi:hypothetical protein
MAISLFVWDCFVTNVPRNDPIEAYVNYNMLPLIIYLRMIAEREGTDVTCEFYQTNFHSPERNWRTSKNPIYDGFLLLFVLRFAVGKRKLMDLGIKNKIVLFIFIASILLPCTLAFGQQVTLPSVNLGGTSFLDGIAGPGLMFSKKSLFLYINAFYETGVENRPEGKKISIRFSKIF